VLEKKKRRIDDQKAKDKKRVIDPRFSSNNRVTPSLSFFKVLVEGVTTDGSFF